jgi:hypothetical protein
VPVSPRQTGKLKLRRFRSARRRLAVIMFDTLDPGQEKLIDQLAELLRVDADPRQTSSTDAIDRSYW